MASDQWYCLRQGQAHGPFSSSQLQVMAQRGELRPDDHLRRGDRTDWVEASRVKGLFNDSGSSSSSQLKRAKPLVEAAGSTSGPPPIPTGQAVPPQAPTEAPPWSGPQVAVGVSPTANGQPAIPVGTAVMPQTVPQGVPVGTPAAQGGDEAEDDVEPGSRKLSPLVLSGGLLAVVVLLLLIGLFVFWKPGGSDANAVADGETAAESDPAPEPPADPESLETDPGAKAAAARASAEGEETAGSAAGSGAEDAATQARLQTLATEAKAAISKWSVAAPTRYLVLRGLARIQVADAWFETVSESSSAGEPATRKLFLEVKLINTSSDKTIGFSSWTGTGKLGDDAQAVLLDSSQVPLDFAAADGRFAKPSDSVGPGETMEEVLAFEVPAETAGDFHLVLPKTGMGLSGYFGFEVPEAMAKLGSPPGASANPAPAVAGAAAANTPTANTPAANTPAANTPAANTPAVVAPAANTPAGDGDVPVIVVKQKDEKGTRPPSLDEINRQIKDFNEQSKPKTDGADAAKPAEPPQNP